MTPEDLTAAPVRIGTRRSRLALWQAHHVRDRLLERWGDALVVELVEIETDGDRIQDRPLHQIGGKGLFVNAIEERLAEGDIDLAVHSMKDLPGALAPGMIIAATPPREDPRDVLVLRTGLDPRLGLDALGRGMVVGTTSLRRGALLRRLRPGVEIAPLRGNVPTRLRKLDEPGEGPALDAIVLAAAGLVRLGLRHRIDVALDPESFCPAATQGILALECRGDDPRLRALLAPLNDEDAADMAAAERAFLARLEGGCQVPMGCHAVLHDGRVRVAGVVADPSGRPYFEASRDGARKDAAAIGQALAEELLELGADKVLAALAHPEP
ncbi:MAG: hydroxymethylbilane synthase [Myxococcales bacterium]|nr:hydroxymethylbilane synthase [Myxococcales bacterium]